MYILFWALYIQLSRVKWDYITFNFSSQALLRALLFVVSLDVETEAIYFFLKYIYSNTEYTYLTNYQL